jgi:trk system potassium uptake protein TrkH
MVAYVNNARLNIITMLLILIGGIGFTTWIDVQNHKWHLRRYSLQSKIVLTATIILVVLPTIYFFFCEFTAFPFKKRLLASLFQSVSPRTAGFNTVNLAKMSDDSKVITIILMMIGGGTGSTAGGIKMTTVSVLLVTCIAVLLRQRDATIFGRRIGQQTLFNAAAVFTLYQVLCLLAALVISHVEHLSFLTSLFECSSAIATVGLTLGVTPHLHLLSQAILILLMFIGRVGSLTVVFAVSRARTVTGARLPEEQVNVG